MMRKFFILILFIPLLGMQSIYVHTHSTNFFRIRYEKSVSSKDAQAAGRTLESAYENIRKKLNIGLSRRVDVDVYSTVERLFADTHTKLFNDGMFRNGKIYLRVKRGAASEMQDVAARVVSRAILDENKACPPWLAEAYSLYAGNNLKTFGQPSRSNLATFSDLAEDFSRTEQAQEQKEVYAELASTMTFLIDRYGEAKINGLFVRFQTGAPLEEIFETAFGEKIDVIQKAWADELTPKLKK